MSSGSKMQNEIIEQCEAVKELLLRKNKDYGNSAAEPIGIFSTATPEEQIDIRIDDKLKRIQNLKGKEGEVVEDTELDLIGYLILKRVVRRV